MQNLQPIKSAAKGTPAVKLSGAQRLDKHMKMKSSNYSTEWRHFKQWLEEQTKIPTPEHGWLVKNDKSTFPKFNLSTLKTYSAWLLENYKKGALTHTQAAINYYYHESGLAAPWIGRSFSRASAKYADARKELMIENAEYEVEGGFLPLGCRVAVPEDVIKWLLQKAEGLETLDTDLPKIATILIGFLFLLRASSLYFEEGDIRFVKDGDGHIATLIVERECVKNKDKATKHQKRCPAPDHELGPKHPRTRIFAIIERALLNDEMFSLVTSSASASDTVTTWMQELIPASVLSLVKGEKIQSHSLRKAGASAMLALGMDLRTVIMPWGEWGTISAAEKYPTRGYIVSHFSGGVFSWCLPATSPFAWQQ